MYPNLPYPSEVYIPFAIFTAEEVTHIDANIKSLASGAGFNAGAIPTAAIANASVSQGKIALSTFGLVDANGWRDYGLFYIKEYNHANTTSITANNSIYVDTASSAGSPPVTEGATFPTSRTMVMVSAASGSSVAQAGVIVSTDISYPRGFFVFNGGTAAATWGTRKITMIIFKA